MAPMPDDGRGSFGRLLVVEDNEVNRLVLARTLELQGHGVTLAENGRQGLDLLAEKPFDLVLLDIEMPELDGFGVLEVMKADPALRELPVIVTSSVEGLDKVVRCIELGAEDYLTKPLNPVLLRARVGAGLEKKRLRDQQADLVRRFATPEVARELQQSGFALGGRRLVGTVMFSDIRGFTSLAESLSPEQTIELLNAYYALVFDAIGSHGGVVNQIIGDGLMAIFGAPAALPDHAGAAARAAQAMLRAVERFNRERGAQGQSAIRVGVGIATGQMVAGYTGTMQRATYTCVGDAVNLAARLEAHTKEVHFDILVDDATRAALGPEVGVRALGEVAFQGMAECVGVFALAASSRR